MDETYKAAMTEHLASLEEDLAELREHVMAGELSPLMRRAAERSLQVLVEACIGIAKQSLKSQGKVVPSEAREAFRKLADMDMDHSQTDWRQVVGLRNALVHDYLNLDPEIIQSIIRQEKYQSLFAFSAEQLNR